MEYAVRFFSGLVKQVTSRNSFILATFIFSLQLSLNAHAILVPSGDDIIIEGDRAGAVYGNTHSGVGDINGDGYPDVVISASTAAILNDSGVSISQAGEAFLYYGGPTGLNTTPIEHFKGDQTSARMGSTVTGDDINGDGYSDLIICASGYTVSGSVSRSGACFLYYGSATGIDINTPFVIEQPTDAWGPTTGETFNLVTANVNGDAYADIVISSRLRNTAVNNVGMVWVYHGSASGLDLTTPDAYTEGTTSDERIGTTLVNAGRTNNDDYDDIIVGTQSKNSYLYLGSASSLDTSSYDTFALASITDAYTMNVAAGVGDINGDGYEDVVFGDNGYDSPDGSGGTISNTGGAYVYYGGITGINTSAPSAILEFDQLNGQVGARVAGIGDVNGDGYSDVGLGAFIYDDETLNSDVGAVFVFTGSAAGINTAANEIIYGDQGSTGYGGVSGAGDIDGDGYADIIIGASGYNLIDQNGNAMLSAGIALVHMGKADGPDIGNMAEALGTAGYYLGYSMADAGDVNGDGYADVIAGTYLYDPSDGGTGTINNAGAAFLFLGTASGLDTASPVGIMGDHKDSLFGYSVSGAGDVNGDGCDDIVIGAPWYHMVDDTYAPLLDDLGDPITYPDGSTMYNNGAAFIYHGCANASGPDTTTPSTTILSKQGNNQFGRPVASAGDVNGDGYDDVVIVSPYYSHLDVDGWQIDNMGAAILYLGSASGIDKNNPIVFMGTQDGSGEDTQASGAGDVNGDGYDDLIVGQPYFDGLGVDGNTVAEAGAAFLYLGGPTGPDPGSPIMMNGELVQATFGHSVSTAGDVNSDGYADLMIGSEFMDAIGVDGNPVINSGAAYVYFGNASGIDTSSPTRIRGTETGEYYGEKVSTAGDINGDGYADIYIGASRHKIDGVSKGMVFAFFGGADGLDLDTYVSMPGFESLAEFGSTMAANDFNNDGYADITVGARRDDIYDVDGTTLLISNAGALYAYTAKSGLYSQPIQVDGSSNPLPSGATSFNTLNVITTTYPHPDGYSKVKLRIEACSTGYTFGDAECVTETSANWSDTTPSGVDVNLSLTLREGLYRWRAQILYASSIIDEPGYSGPTSAVAHTPWRSSNAVASGTDIKIAIDTNTDGTPDNIAPTIDGTPDTTAIPGTLYSFAAIGDDYNANEVLTYSITSTDALPGWLSFNTSTGVLSGTPGDSDFGTTTGIIISISDGEAAPVSLPAFDLAVIDSASPVILSSVEINDLSGDHTITLTCVDNGSGCAGPIYYTTDGSIPTILSSVYNGAITVSAGTPVLTLTEDNQGNISTVQAADFVSIVTPASDYIGAVATIDGTIDETYASVSSVTIQVYGDDGTVLLESGGNLYLLPPPAVALPLTTTLDNSLDSWSYSRTISWVNDVEYTIVATATDVNGNTSSASSSFVYFNGTPSSTELLLTLTTNSILNGGSLDATLTFTKLNELDADLTGIPLILHVTGPDAIVTDITGLQTNYAGQLTLEQLGAGGFGISFDKPGAWSLQAEFDNASYPNMAGTFSSPESLLVGSSAGYAVLVQGKLPNDEGLESHNKTANRIYNTLKDRGLADQDIHYFNYDVNQSGVDELPIKANIQSTIEGLATDIASRPAPVYIIMVDHGGKATETLSARFYIDDEVITPTELDSWLGTLETNMGGIGSQLAIDNPRIVIIGACYSGGFISDVTGTGRVIITSATENEQSYKGPVEDDHIRVGEYFLEELFLELAEGENLRDAFKTATTKTETYTKESSGDTSTNSDNEYLDTAVQHPLMDDDADGLGTNALFENSADGHLSKDLVLGINPDSLTNDVFNPADIVSVTNSQYLADGVSTADLTLIANDAFQVNQAYVEIRTPQTTLASAVENTTEQLTSDFDRRALTPPAIQGDPYTLTYTSFVQPGKYEIFYYVNDRFTGALSPAKRSIVYKDRPPTTVDIDPNMVNDAPGAFDLLTPVSGDTDITIIGFDWEDSVDPEGDAVTYNFIIADSGTFDSFTQSNGDGTCTQLSEPYRQEELTSSSSFVDAKSKLCDLSTYVWKVEAVDAYGQRTTSTSVFTYNTNDTNADVGVIVAMVKSATTNQQLTAANITNGLGESAEATASVEYNGNYVLFTQNTGTAQIITASLGDYASKDVNLANVTSGETVEILFNMDPDPLLDNDGDGVVDVDDNCPTDANADQADFDADGLGDVFCDTDDDNDGIPDSYENSYAFLDPFNASDAALDQDGDTISNLDEYRDGTDPSVFNVIPSDVDGDTIDDSVDNCIDDYNLDQLDTDTDGEGDVCDLDDDNDTMPDAFEIVYGLDPLVDDAAGDLDVDGVLNIDEYLGGTNPAVVNPDTIDTDSDGVVDVNDNCPDDSNALQTDTDSDTIGDACDNDDDNDGVIDTSDAFPLDATETVDTDGDGIGNNADTNDDGDAVADTSDAFPLDAAETVDTDHDGIGNNADTDDDGDGVVDTSDEFPLDASETVDTDSDGTGNNADSDDDNDTMPDAFEVLYGLNPLVNDAAGDLDVDGISNLTEYQNGTNPAVVNSDTVDTDGDGVTDVTDNCPAISNATQTDTDSDSVGDACDNDDDNDGVIDTSDAFPLDATETVDTDGDGTGDNADTNDDGDAVADASDAFPLDAAETVDTDHDGIGNNADTDDDGDGVVDTSDAFPLDASESVDTDSDGTGNNADSDDDADGMPDAFEIVYGLDPLVDDAAGDLDVDGVLNIDEYLGGTNPAVVNSDTVDTDGDGVTDVTDNCPAISNATQTDNDSDSAGDACDADDDNDGVIDTSDAFPLDATETVDTDGDGTGNNADTNDDGDAVADASDAFPLDAAETVDTDHDGIGNNADTDDDGDGVIDTSDEFPLDATETTDTDSDGTGNNADSDDDNDTMPDAFEELYGLNPLVNDAAGDFDGDGISNLTEYQNGTNPAIVNADTIDTDSDGVVDVSDNCPATSNAAQTDTDGDSAGNACDADDDNDGVIDTSDAFPLDATETVDTDSDGIGNNADTNDDGDAVADSSDDFPLDATETVDTDNDGIGNNADTDDDADGVIDTSDAFPLDVTESTDTDSDGVGNNADSDDDNDGMPDSFELVYSLNPLVNDANDDADSDGVSNIDEYLGGTNPNVVNSDTVDTDSDGVTDITDNCPATSNPAQTDTDADTIGDACDADDDNDGVIDTSDTFPLDVTETIDTDSDGIGNNADTNDDGDAVADASDAFPLDATETVDTDHDGIGNNADTDDDGDGVIDTSDDFPLDATETTDTDSDGAGNNSDDDDDNDGMPDAFETLYGLNPLANDASADADSDGVSNINEYLGGTNPNVVNSDTTDTDSDGVTDVADNCPAIPNGAAQDNQLDTDSDGAGDACDADDDNDGVADGSDAFPTDATETLDTDSDGIGNNTDTDDDGDTVADASDAFPLDATETIDTDHDGIGNNADTDDDGDGVVDSSDIFPLDANESVDTDTDGIGNNADSDDDADAMPDAFETLYGLDPLVDDAAGDFDGDGVINLTEYQNGTNPAVINIDTIDTDLDGIADITDNCPNTSNGTQADSDTDSIGDACDTDDDNDGVADGSDAFPFDASETVDTDGDGIGNNADTDDDADGVVDTSDAFPLDANETVDTDKDGVGNSADLDDDGDGVADGSDAFPFDASETVDTDGDGIGNNTDDDDDGDGMPDAFELLYGLNALVNDANGDADSDSVTNINEYLGGTNPNVVNSDTVDTDGDGVTDVTDNCSLIINAAQLDNDSDGAGDACDADDDNDGVIDTSDAFQFDATETLDTDGDGIGNNADTDDDADGVVDSSDAFPLDAAETVDTDGDGTGNNADTDDDADGVADTSDIFPLNAFESADTDSDGIGNNADIDDDADGMPDAFEILYGLNSLVNDANGDLDTDGVTNLLEYQNGTNPSVANADTIDTDSDGVVDVSDNCPTISNNTQTDTDSDTVGDACDVDDDNDGVADGSDIFPLDGTESIDTDTDGIGNNSDTDDDGDGMSDVFEMLYGLDPLVDDASGDLDGDSSTNLQEFINGTDPTSAPGTTTDLDGDSVVDALDNCPSTSNVAQTDTDTDSLGDACDTDDDNDSVPDVIDAFPLDSNESVDTDLDGIGNNADTDDDGDGVADSSDAFPLDASESVDTDADGVGNNTDGDDDNDGVVDGSDAFPLNNAESVDTDSDGTGNNADTDDDADGVIDTVDDFPLDASETVDTDSDGIGNNTDTDDDGDSVIDTSDDFPLDATETVDTDGDGIGNNTDSDDDADGMPDAFETLYGLDPLVDDANADADSDSVLNIDEYLGGTNPNVVNSSITDTDGDGVTDVTDNCPAIANGAAEDNQLDTDSDGAGDVCDADDDNDGVIDTSDAFPFDAAESVDTDADGTGNNADTDDDADGVTDGSDAFPLDATEDTDTDHDGIGNNTDSDDDGDGVADGSDAFPLDDSETLDTDSDGVGNNTDSDDDGDGMSDAFEILYGLNPVFDDANNDADNDGVINIDEYSNGTNPVVVNSDTIDTDSDGVTDVLDNCPTVANGVAEDNQLDTDSDGTGNACDADDDNDTVLDASDVFPLDSTESSDFDSDGTGDNADTDDDGDGMSDVFEVLYNLNSKDAGDAGLDPDGDALTNLIEFQIGTNPNIDNSITIDSDADGIDDVTDNCPTVANTDQLDTDGDTAGDVCDNDKDNDGVVNSNDLFPLDSTESADFDLDGMGNNADPDDDNDGMSDEYEILYAFNPYDSSDAANDADGDGMTNLEEYQANTSPKVSDIGTTSAASSTSTSSAGTLHPLMLLALLISFGLLSRRRK